MSLDLRLMPERWVDSWSDREMSRLVQQHDDGTITTLELYEATLAVASVYRDYVSSRLQLFRQRKVPLPIFHPVH